MLKLFNEDPDTHGVMMIGEIGGTAEEPAPPCDQEEHEEAGGRRSSPAPRAPPGKRMGHAGAIIAGGKGTAAGEDRRPHRSRGQSGRHPGRPPARNAAKLAVITLQATQRASGCSRTAAGDPCGRRTFYGTPPGFPTRQGAPRRGAPREEAPPQDAAMQASPPRGGRPDRPPGPGPRGAAPPVLHLTPPLARAGAQLVHFSIISPSTSINAKIY